MNVAAAIAALLLAEPGSAVGWENHRFPGTTAFVVELPAGSLSQAAATHYARAALALAQSRKLPG